MAATEIIESKVKGISHYQASAQACASGDTVTLVPDPDNRYHPQAVGVEHQGQLIGYLERALAADLHDLVKQNRVKARVKEVLGGSAGYLTGIKLILEVDRYKVVTSTLELSAIEPLQEILSGPLLSTHDVDTAVGLGTTIEMLRQKLRQYKENLCSADQLGIAAQHAYEKYRFQILPDAKCSDSLRIAGISAVILGDKGMGVYSYYTLHSLCDTEVPPHVLKLLSVLQLHFSPTDNDVVPPDQSHLEAAIDYCTGRRRPKDLAVALHLVERQLNQGRRSDLDDIINSWSQQHVYEPIALVPLVLQALIASDEQGNATAMCNLGMCYYSGQGVEKDRVQSFHWFQKAAEQGDANAMGCLGLCYHLGDGVEQDDAKAFHWYHKAAEHGNVGSMSALGGLYYSGDGVEKDDAKAFHWFQKAAEQGNVRSMSALGGLYYSGDGVEKDDAKAFHWHHKAAEHGNVRSMSALGGLYYSGDGVEKDDAKAFHWWQKAAEHGNVWSMSALGGLYYSGDGVEKDRVQSFHWFQKAAEQGDANAMYMLGPLYLQGQGVERDDAQALHWYHKAAEHGNVRAMSKLGECYERGNGAENNQTQNLKPDNPLYWYQKQAEHGIGGFIGKAVKDLSAQLRGLVDVEQDDAQAIYWYEKAAEHGNVRAMSKLGECYERGNGVKKDDAKAFYWHQKAAEHGHAEAMFKIAVCYHSGKGVGQDDAQAAQWYQKAAEQGNATAMFALGVCYRSGEGVEQDREQAVHWYQKAAEQGNATAMFALGACYHSGQGVKPDDAQAAQWYQKAAEQGHAEAMARLAGCYRHGKGVEKDHAQAVHWSKKAGEKNSRSPSRSLSEQKKHNRVDGAFERPKSFYPESIVNEHFSLESIVNEQPARATSRLAKFKWVCAALAIIGLLLMGFAFLRYGPRMGIHSADFVNGLMCCFLPFGGAWLLIHFISQRRSSQQESDESSSQQESDESSSQQESDESSSQQESDEAYWLL